MAEPQKLPQEWFLGVAEQRHVGAVFAPAEHGAEGDHQDLVQIMPRVVLTRVLKLRKTPNKPLHGTPKCRIPWLESIPRGCRKHVPFRESKIK